MQNPSLAEFLSRRIKKFRGGEIKSFVGISEARVPLHTNHSGSIVCATGGSNSNIEHTGCEASLPIDTPAFRLASDGTDIGSSLSICYFCRLFIGGS
jgi:hypothetical protein